MKIRSAVFFISMALLIGCTSQPGASATPTASIAAVVATPPAPTQAAAPGKLSARLIALADPTVSAQDSAAQARALSLPATGPGSLVRNDKGEVRVVVHMNDVSQSALDGLTATGFSTTNVATAFKTVTGYIRPDHLRTLVALPTVENVREELSP